MLQSMIAPRSSDPSAAERHTCTWCQQSTTPITEDEIFPRSIGGTKHLWVPSCIPCQNVLSKVEHDVSRRSLYALKIAGAGPRGRHKRSTSGVIEAELLIVRHPLGGYSESGLRAGGQAPTTLPSIEIDVGRSWNGRTRGACPEDVDQLRAVLSEMFDDLVSQPDTVREVSVKLIDQGDSEIAEDPDFWPRAFLDLGGRLFIRARDVAEATEFMSALQTHLEAGAFRDHSSWQSGRIESGTPHRVHLSFLRSSVLRIVAKIGYGLAFLHYPPELVSDALLDHVRRYVIKGVPEDSPPVHQFSDHNLLERWKDEHVASVGVIGNDLVGIVSLYGDIYKITFGPVPLTFRNVTPVGAVCSISARRVKLLAPADAATKFKSLSESIGTFDKGSEI